MAPYDEEESIELDSSIKQATLNEIGLDEPLDEPEEEHDTAIAKRRQGIRYYLICTLMGSLMTAASKAAMKDTDQYVIMFARMFGTFVISALWMVYSRTEHFLWGPPGLRLFVFTRGLSGTLGLSLAYYAVQYMTLPDYSVLNFLAPLLTAVAARVLLGEPYHWIQAVASGISFIGVVIITRPSFIFGDHMELPAGVTLRQHTSAVICCLLTVLCTTVSFIVLRALGSRVSAHTLVAQYALQTCVLSGAIIIIRVTLLGANVKFPNDVKAWTFLVFIGVVGFTYQFFLNTAVGLVRASVLTQFDYITLIYMMVWQFILFHTLPDIISLVGGTLIIAGVLCSTRVRT